VESCQDPPILLLWDTEVGHEVQVEPRLQLITGKQFPLVSSNVEDGASLLMDVWEEIAKEL